MTHCHSGVEKGVKKGGNPIEVMGLLLGRPGKSALVLFYDMNSCVQYKVSTT